MKTYVIGRGTEAQIQLPASDVSRAHAEITMTDADNYYLVDRASTGKTYLLTDGNWEAIGQSFVAIGDSVRFSTYETTVGDLMALVGAAPGATSTALPAKAPIENSPEPPRASNKTSGPRPWRDPLTGEVVYKS